jgi:hypothetical protein
VRFRCGQDRFQISTFNINEKMSSSKLKQKLKSYYETFKSSNKNVKTAIFCQFISQMSTSVWLETATPFWIENQTHSAVMVGWGSGAEGICLLIFSIVAGKQLFVLLTIPLFQNLIQSISFFSFYY